MTFVKAKVALDDLETDQILQIRLNDGEPIQNVPRSLKDDGHKVLSLADNGDGTYNLLVRKGQD
jgi:TusA-related sulfurtransferase